MIYVSSHPVIVLFRPGGWVADGAGQLERVRDGWSAQGEHAVLGLHQTRYLVLGTCSTWCLAFGVSSTWSTSSKLIAVIGTWDLKYLVFTKQHSWYLVLGLHQAMWGHMHACASFVVNFYCFDSSELSLALSGALKRRFPWEKIKNFSLLLAKIKGWGGITGPNLCAAITQISLLPD